MSARPRVVILNGPSSAGKGSIAKALQDIARGNFLHVQMDNFIAMMPARSDDHPDGFTCTTIQEDGRPSVVIVSGPVAERAMQGMRHAIAAMAGQGNDLIVDDVMLDGMADDYRRLLAAFEVILIGVSAPLPVLEAREIARGDRMIGMARWQHERVHRNMHYDFTVDTGSATAAECAAQIQCRFDL